MNTTDISKEKRIKAIAFYDEEGLYERTKGGIIEENAYAKDVVAKDNGISLSVNYLVDVLPDELKYDCDYNWLMPVFVKASSECVIMGRIVINEIITYVSIKPNQTSNQFSDSSYDKKADFISMLFNVVSDFCIDWCNQNNISL